MTKQYLVRAELAFGFLDGTPVSTALPASIGPFRIDHSPNAGLFLTDRGFIQPDQVRRKTPDPQFPMSLLYLEYGYASADNQNPTKHADDALDRFERLLRLFQAGEVTVLRHGLWRIAADGGLTPFLSFDFRPVKLPIEGLHEYGSYPLNDATLGSLVQFVDVYWPVLGKIEKTQMSLQTAISRFSSSYEKRSLADRMIDLVIALEALFGDSEAGGIAYKVAMRAACWLHATEEERCAAFDTIKKVYRHRSEVVHGNPGKPLTGHRVNELEGMIRSGLRKFLDWQVQHGKTPSSRDIDGLIMAGKI